MACDIVDGVLAVPGGVILEEDSWLVDHSVSPVMLAGFLIAKPTRHVEHIAHLTDGEAPAMGRVLRKASDALMRVLAPEKVYVCSFGSLVRHVHFYLVPRLDSMPAELGGAELLGEVFTGRWACSDEEAAEIARKLRQALLS
jgi:diadenosine tetraphosphate (Ap4A) HIT family hydrolase